MGMKKILLTILVVAILLGGGYYVYQSRISTLPKAEKVPENKAISSTESSAREAACPSPGPACPSPQSPVCREGKWYCREHTAGAAAGARVFPETNNIEGLNFPTGTQLRQACGEPALACEVPSIPDCRNGKWGCVPPATGSK